MRGIVLVASLLTILLLASVPGSVQAFDLNGVAVVEADGHEVLLNFTVSSVPAMNDMENAGSLRYLIYLADGSAQTNFDVLLLTAAEYGRYLEGEAFSYVANASFLQAGAVPASMFHVFLEEGEYVLLVDNTDAGTVPDGSGELTVSFEIVAENVDVQRETQWLPFILLMVLVCIIGVGFLVVLNMAMNARLKNKMAELDERCPGCQGRLPDYGRFCPHCGRER